MREVLLRETYPDGLRDTLSCGHVVYVADTRLVARRRCLLCIRPEKRRFRWQKSRR